MGRQLRREARLWHNTLCSRSPMFWVNPQVFLHFYASRQLRVTVRDNGIGIDPLILNSGREGHWGLIGIRERSKRIGATLRLRSRTGAGTEVDLTVPGSIAFDKSSNGATPKWLRWLSRERLEMPKHDKEKRVHK